MNFGFIKTADCIDVAPEVDSRCSDPAFALANPTICPPQSQLIVKPGYSLACVLGSVQYKAFLVTSGVEVDVTADSIFATSDMSVAMIGALSGNATALSQGEATISATYGTLTATSTLTVIGATGDACCDAIQVGMMVLVDNSRSMSQAMSGAYQTRLDFAKAAATQFIGEVNQTKDVVGLASFNLASVLSLASPSSDKAAVGALVPTIAQSQQKTEFYNALTATIAELDAAAPDLKVILLISDGEDTSDDAGTGYSSGYNPIELLSNFKDQGGVVICLGCRASGPGFARLSAFATGGFFINAYASIEAVSLAFLSGLKGYICAGNCTPAGDTIVATPELNYTGFANWDVTAGQVDLIGPGLFDFLPGNGLYVDLMGSTSTAYGTLKSKVTYALESGHTYRVSVQLAGNQRLDDSPYSALLRLFYGVSETELVHQSIVINDHAQDFQTYTFSFTAPADVDAYVSIAQESIPTGLTGLSPYFGLLLGRVVLEDTTDLITLLDDNFDTENLQYVPPRCGLGTTYYGGGYTYGYACEGEGCLTDPPDVQLPDPTPLPDIESGYTPPQTYTSTRQACASCATGFTNFSATEIAGVTIAASTPPTVPEPEYYTSVTYDLGSTQAIAAYDIDFSYADAPINGWLLEGSDDLLTWATVQTIYAPPLLAPPQTAKFPVVNATAYRYYRFTVTPREDAVPTGFGDISFYAPRAAQGCSSATRTSTASQAAADALAYAAALAEAQAGLNCVPLYTATDTHTASCPPGTYGGGDVQRSATAYSFISQSHAEAEAHAAALAAAEAALACTGSNNTQPITIPSPNSTTGEGPASLYPSVEYVTSAITSITKVTVTLKQLTIQSVDDMVLMLIGPDGTAVLLCQFGSAMNMNLPIVGTPIDLTFDDAGALFVAGVAPTTGSYQCISFAPTDSGLLFPAPYPGPDTPNTTLAAFNGKNPNGAWSLWAVDIDPLLTGLIAHGWELTIT